MLEQFQSELEEIKKDFESLCNKFEIKNGVVIQIIDNRIVAAIDVNEFRKD